MQKFSRLMAAIAAVGALSAVAGSAAAGTPSTTTTGLASSQNPSNIGQNTTLTATVTENSNFGTCTGTVQFRDGATPLVCTGGTQTIAGAYPTYTATCAVSFPSSGPQSLTAVYSGGGVCNNSTSPALTQNVTSPAPVPTLGGWAIYLLTPLLLGGGLWIMARRNRGLAL